MYALLFIAAMLLVGLTVDRHNHKAHRGLTRAAPVHLGERPSALRPVQSMQPTAQPRWQHGRPSTGS